MKISLAVFAVGVFLYGALVLLAWYGSDRKPVWLTISLVVGFGLTVASYRLRRNDS